MNAAIRRKLLAYAIPADLVVVATGVGLLVPGILPVVLIGLYVVAVALSAWKSGWLGAVAAMVLSSCVLLVLFSASVPRDEIGWLIAAGVLVSIPLAALRASRRRDLLSRQSNVLLLPEPIIAGRQSIEEAAAEAINDQRHRKRGAAVGADKTAAAGELDAAPLEWDAKRAEPQQRPRVDEVVEIARDAVTKPEPASEADAAPQRYDVTCANCRVIFDAADADWCSCLARDRTVVCTNCLTCFCRAAPAYKEIFWSDAPPRLLERKAAELRHHSLTMAANAAPSEVRRPLVMFVDGDPDNQAIMQRVCANLGYGVVSSGGQDALAIARTYRPNLILADAILPRLDGRELCRLLKEDPAFAATRFVVMTGLYADTKFKPELMQRFGIDDCLAKPVSITDVINLLQRHIEGVRDLPAQENLYELHRIGFGMPDDARTAYEISCITCGDMFDAVKAPWCACAEGDHTLACEQCGGCFCDAVEYRQRFWAGAPAVLFERKTIVEPRSAPTAMDKKRPLLAVIEDDESTQLLVRTIASTLGYGFVGYANGNEAVAQESDLILFDALLSRHDSRDIARRLKSDPATASSKVVIMSGRASDPEFRHDAATRLKADDCLAKPLAAADIIEMLKKYLPRAGTTG
jgi:CheY-like chemotaxis protein